MSIQVAYEIDHVSLLQDSSKLLFFYVFCCNPKEKGQITRNINIKKGNLYIGNQYYYYFGLPKIRIGWVHTTKN